MKAVHQSAYIVHSRPYRETSFIVELFTRDFGRVACVAKGARRAKRGSGIPQLFVPVLVSWVGRGPLFTMTDAEVQPTNPAAAKLEGEYLVCGLYMNELIVRLLEPGDPHAALFDGYKETLEGLGQRAPMSVVLRRFEYLLLGECGYAPDFTRCTAGIPIEPAAHYELVVEEGFRRVQTAPERQSHTPISKPADAYATEHYTGEHYTGEAVLAVAAGDYARRDNRRAALRIFRTLLDNQMGDRGLVSRSLLSAGRND